MSGPAYYTAQINIAKNDDWLVPFVYQVINPDSSTSPIDLTGSTLMMEIRHHDVDHEVAVSVSSPANGITITDAPHGKFTVVIDRDLLANVEPGSYVGDLIRLMTNGYQERIIDAAVTIVEGVTR